MCPRGNTHASHHWKAPSREIRVTGLVYFDWISQQSRWNAKNFRALRRAGGTVGSVARHKICICLLAQVQGEQRFYVTGDKRHDREKPTCFVTVALAQYSIAHQQNFVSCGEGWKLTVICRLCRWIFNSLQQWMRRKDFVKACAVSWWSDNSLRQRQKGNFARGFPREEM